jgi:hypothetical protein
MRTDASLNLKMIYVRWKVNDAVLASYGPYPADKADDERDRIAKSVRDDVKVVVEDVKVK